MKKRFIFDDNYNKKQAKREMPKRLVFGALLLLLIIVVIIVILATRKNDNSNKKPVSATPVYELKEELLVESGSSIPKREDFFTKLENVDLDEIEVFYPADFEISYDTALCSEEDIEKLNKEEVSFEDLQCTVPYLKNPSVYGVTVKLQEKEQTVLLVVQDTTAPNITTKDVEIFAGEEYKVEDFVTLCYDITGGCNVHFEKEDYANIKEAGEHTLSIIAEDNFGNKSNPKSVKLNIKEVEHKLHTIKFNSDGGSNIDDIIVEEGSNFAAPTNPTKNGYNFKGWYNGNNPYDFSAPVVQDITLKAKWEKVSSSGGNTTPQVSVSLDFKTIYLTVGQTKSVKATVKNSNDKVVWTSGNKNIATVKDGQITGVKEGTTYVTATVGGKSAKVEVIVRKSTGTTCKFGDTSYNSNYIMSVKLATGNCALDPNTTPNETVTMKDRQKLFDELRGLGINYSSDNFSYRPDYYKIKNNAGTGLVGYKITVTVSVIDNDNPYIVLTSKYVIKSDGSREYISNKICKNNVCLK